MMGADDGTRATPYSTDPAPAASVALTVIVLPGRNTVSLSATDRLGLPPCVRADAPAALAQIVTAVTERTKRAAPSRGMSRGVECSGLYLNNRRRGYCVLRDQSREGSAEGFRTSA